MSDESQRDDESLNADKVEDTAPPLRYCAAHGAVPDPDAIRGCYGELFTCLECGRDVCAGFGAADDAPELCDDCWSALHPTGDRHQEEAQP